MGLLGRRKRFKFKYSITVHEVSHLPDDGSLVFVKWKRGKKAKNRGETKKVLVNDGYAFWHEDIILNGTLYKADSGKFKKKQLHIELMKDSEKKRKSLTLGKITIDLHDTTVSNILSEVQFTKLYPVKLKRGEAQLKITLHSECLSDYNADEGMTVMTESTTVGETSNTLDSGDDNSLSRENEYDPDPGHISPITSHSLETSETNAQAIENTEHQRNSTDFSPRSDSKGSPPKFPSAPIQQPSSTNTWTDSSVATSSANVPPPPQPAQETRNRFAALRNSQARRKKNLSSSDYSFSSPTTKSSSSVSHQNEMNSSGSKLPIKHNMNHDDSMEVEDALNFLIEHLVDYTQRPYFVDGIPVTAAIFFRVLEQWNCFEGYGDMDTLRQIIKAIDGNTHLHSDEIEKQCYWFTNCLAFLYLTRTHCQYTASDQETRNIPELELTLPKHFSYFSNDERETKVYRIPKSFPEFSLEEIENVESALIQFRIDISRVALRIYGGLLARICEKMTTILVPAFFEIKSNIIDRSVSLDDVKDILRTFMDAFEDAYIPNEISIQFFQYVYSFIDAYLLNTLLVDKELCTLKYAIPLKTGISELEWWANKNTNQETKSCLKHIRQAADILILTKDAIEDPSMQQEVWPDLKQSQVRALLENYQPDAEMGAEAVPSEVIESLNTSTSSPQIDVSKVHTPNLNTVDNMGDWRSISAPETIREHSIFSWLS